MLRNLFAAGTLTLMLFGNVTVAHAQVDRATLTGIVRDPSDAVISAAKVRITSLATNSVASATTSNDGTYLVVNLAPGEYLVQVEAPGFQRFEPRLIRPEDCGFEIRGGGNATRQIVDIIPPSAPADRLLICEVFTPAGNWSSYPPHKHDVDRPPREVKLEEIYYYRFADRDAFGFQRLYDHGKGGDQALTVTHGDVVLVRSGYHTFVTAHGYDAYYLNVLAGTRRSMAASDDPRYASLRQWPPRDPRLPLVAPPAMQ